MAYIWGCLKIVDIIVREMDICQDINMYVGCDLASSVSRRKSAHGQYVEALSEY